MHNYDVFRIWNYDEFGAQATHNGDSFVFPKTRLKNKNKNILNKR
jgi:hypothetical protein